MDVEGRREVLFCARANSTIVFRRNEPSRWQCSSALGHERISSRFKGVREIDIDTLVQTELESNDTLGADQTRVGDRNRSINVTFRWQRPMRSKDPEPIQN